MRNVYLLRSLISQIAKARQRRSTRLEARERFGQIMLREIVVAREMLVLRKLMVDLRCKLVAPLVSKRYSLKRAVRTIRQRNVLVQKIECRLIHASCRNLIVSASYSIRKNSRRDQSTRGIVSSTVVRACGDGRSTSRGHGGSAAGTCIQRIDEKLIANGTGKR